LATLFYLLKLFRLVRRLLPIFLFRQLPSFRSILQSSFLIFPLQSAPNPSTRWLYLFRLLTDFLLWQSFPPFSMWPNLFYFRRNLSFSDLCILQFPCTSTRNSLICPRGSFPEMPLRFSVLFEPPSPLPLKLLNIYLLTLPLSFLI